MLVCTFLDCTANWSVVVVLYLFRLYSQLVGFVGLYLLDCTANWSVVVVLYLFRLYSQLVGGCCWFVPFRLYSQLVGSCRFVHF